MIVIEAQNLSKHFQVLNRREGLVGTMRDLFSTDYRTVKAVNEISMQIHEGEIVGYIGPNGAGKSTTIKMMTGILQPSGGQLTVNGNVPYQNRQRNAQNIGVVFGQRTQLWWDLPVIESFKILKEIYRVDDALYTQNLGIFNDLVNLSDLYSKPVRMLSLGQRMLCDIAASFLHSPKVVFLDEPTIGLDISVKGKIRRLIRELNAEHNTTIILTTHDISDIEALCERVIIIDKGTIIFDDKVQKVKTLFGSYRTLNLQFSPHLPRIIEEFQTKLKDKFGENSSVKVNTENDEWLSVTINQEQIPLRDVLYFAMENFRVTDVNITEIATEDVVQRIYEGYDDTPPMTTSVGAIDSSLDEAVQSS